MSGQQIGSVAGGLIGAFFGGPTGYAIGSAIGGAIGGYIDPTVVKGPRLTDAMQQTVSDGVPLPWGLGTFPTAGNIIWAGELIERKHEDDGKGSGQVQVTYTYHRSFAISICQGVRQPDGTYEPIAGILQVKRSGKVVYDVSPGVSSEQQAQNAKFLRDHYFVLGSEGQPPSSVLEAELGVGNAPAFPGTVVMYAENVNLGGPNEAMIPQYEFVVSVCGEVTEESGGASSWVITYGTDLEDSSSRVKESDDGVDWTAPGITPSFGDRIWNPVGRVFMRSVSGAVLATTGAPGSGSVNAMFRASGSSAWSECELEDTLNASSGDIAYTTEWLIQGSHPGSTRPQGSSDGVTFSATGTYLSNAGFIKTWTEFQGNAVGFAGLSNGEIWLFDPEGKNPSLVADNVTGTVGAHAIRSGGGRLCLLSVAGGVATVHSAQEPEGPWTEEVADLFPGQPLSGEPLLHYSNSLGSWFAIVGNRVAMGSAPSEIEDAGHVLASRAYGIDDDGTKAIVCGANGMLESWDPTNGWKTVDSNTESDIFGIVAIRPQGQPIPDAPGWYIGDDGNVIGPGGTEIHRCKPTIGEIVAEACLRSGLAADDFDVSELTDEVDGFKVAIDTTGEAIIGSLMPGWFFDAAEYDDKIRFPKRGGDVVAELTTDDLCESDGDVIEETELQEVELLRKVHVKTIDPAAGFTVTTQTAERRTSTVNAKGEQTIEVAVVTDKDTQAQIADKKLKVGWAETRRFKTSIPYTRPDLTVADVIGLTDRKGKRSRVRLMEMAEDSGRIRIDEAMLDRQAAYTSNVEGVAHAPPTDTSPGLIGPTFGVAMNLPRLRTSENSPGAHLAACGYLSGWAGCTVLLSSDGGASYQQVTTFTEPSSMGILREDATDNSEPLRVFMRSGSISSVTNDQLAARLNAWAITTAGVSEVGQTKTAVQDSSGIYELTGNVRGALGTTPAAHQNGDPFVMLGSTQFVPLDMGLSGRTLYFKFVSFGTSPDDVEPVPFVFNPQFTGPANIEPYTDDSGNVYTDDAGNTYFYEST